MGMVCFKISIQTARCCQDRRKVIAHKAIARNPEVARHKAAGHIAAVRKVAAAGRTGLMAAAARKVMAGYRIAAGCHIESAGC